MQVLVLGGTQFIGRHTVEALLAAGHTVSILTRGQTPDPLPESVERLRGDRDLGVAGLEALAGRTWDACVDVCGYTPKQVGASVALLSERVQRYVFFSAVRVYATPTERPVRESHPRVPPAAEDITEIDDTTYGPLKVACENLVVEAFRERATVLRPQVVVGPHDPSHSYAHWVRRAALGGETLAPGDGSDHLQVIDVRDVARFVVIALEHNHRGAYNLAGPRITWAEFIALLGVDRPIWVPVELLSALPFWELPLYRPEHSALGGLMDISNERARAAGLTLTDPATTLEDIRAWCQTLDIPRALSAEREAEILRRVTGQTP